MKKSTFILLLFISYYATAQSDTLIVDSLKKARELEFKKLADPATINSSINNNFDKLALCKSGSSSVTFTTTLVSGTVFNVELSNSLGSFTSPTIIGSGTISPISITIPTSLTSSNNYKIRIVTAEANPQISNESAAFSIRSVSENSLFISTFSNVNQVNGAYNFCNGANVALFSNISTINNSYALPYIWSGPNGFIGSGQNVTISNTSAASAGTYTVTCTIESCQTYTATTQLSLTNSLSIRASPSSSTICPSASTSFSTYSNVFTTSIPTYSWVGPNSFMSTSQFPTIINAPIAAAGVYTITATFTGSCAGTTTATVNLNVSSTLPVSSGYSGSNCNGSTITLSSSVNTSTSGLTLSYSWAGPNGFISSLQNPIVSNISASNAGAYSVTISYTGTCSGSNTSTINLILSNPTIQYSGSTQYCVGLTTNIIASMSRSGLTTQYSWSGPNSFTSTGSTLAITNFTSANVGVYTITAIYTGSCNGTATSTVSLNLNTVGTSIVNPPTYCIGATTNNYAVLTNSGLTTQYTWSGPNGYTSIGSTLAISNFSSINEGVYTVTAAFAGGCNGTATTYLSISTPQLYPDNERAYCQGRGAITGVSSNMNLNYASYSWMGPNGFTSTEALAIINGIDATNAGIYTVTVGFGNGCNTTLTATTILTMITTITPMYIYTPKAGGEYCQNTGNISLSPRPFNTAFVFTNRVTSTWTGPNGFSSTTTNGRLVSISSSDISNSGIYTLALTSTGCVGTATATTFINISTQPKVTSFSYTNGSVSPFIQVNNTINVCEGNYFYIEASANGISSSYSWIGPNSFASTNRLNYFSPHQTPNVAGVYTVTANITGACAGTATATVQVNFNNSTIPAPTITVSPQNYRLGETVTFTANCPTTVSWNNSNLTTNMITVTLPNYDTGFYAYCKETESCLSPQSNQIWFNQCRNYSNFSGTITRVDTKYESNDIITSTIKIIPISNITCDSQKSITLNPGFEVQSGSIFKAQIDGCGNN
jgi:trimeric autotransporter adhesin